MNNWLMANLVHEEIQDRIERARDPRLPRLRTRGRTTRSLR